jgi:hypothetical protein
MWKKLFLMISLVVTSNATMAQNRGQHGEGHAKLHHWYEKLMRPDTHSSCCNDKDCRPTQHRYHEGKLQVLLDGKWENVPERALLKNEHSPDLQSHVCALEKSPWSYGADRIVCVVLGHGV